jgi:acetyl-CoA acetyltransferase
MGLGFCGEGGAAKFIADGDNTYGGRVVTNPSGGLLSKGHPLGATGLAQCFELTHQLRGTAGPRQVDGVRHLSHETWPYPISAFPPTIKALFRLSEGL